MREMHGKRNHPLYGTWASIKTRTSNPNSVSYKHYGAKGIAMCQEWASSFSKFIADVGPRPSHRHTLDRYPDRGGDYKPGNVRWATAKEQSRNRDGLRLVSYEGGLIPLSEFAEKVGVNYFSLRGKMERDSCSHVEAATQLLSLTKIYGCGVDGCLATYYASGLCSRHYQLSRRKKKEVSAANTSGYRGVSFHSASGKWLARVTIDGYRHHIGVFETKEQANEAITTFKEKNHADP